MLIVWLYDIIGFKKLFRSPIVNDKLALLKLSSLGDRLRKLVFYGVQTPLCACGRKAKTEKNICFQFKYSDTWECQI